MLNASFQRQSGRARRSRRTRPEPDPAPPGTYEIVREVFDPDDVHRGAHGDVWPALDYVESVAPPGVTIEMLGPSSDTGHAGQEMYGYLVGDPAKPAIFITGPHGHEWAAYVAIARVAQRWHTPDGPNAALYEALADAFSLYVIPIGNPFGWRTFYRRNANDVDINRNFDPPGGQWDDYHSDTNPGGPYPWSEPETVVIRDKVLGLAPVVAIDVHTTGGAPGGIAARWSHYSSPHPYDVLAGRTYGRLSQIMPGLPVRAWDTSSLPCATSWYDSLMASTGQPVYGQIVEGTHVPGTSGAYPQRASSCWNMILAICAEWLRFWETGVQ